MAREESPSVDRTPKLDVEREKLALEFKRLAVEKSKARWSAITIFIPLLIGAMTLVFNSWSQLQQAKSDFQLKAVEIVMAMETPTGTKNKAGALVELFPGRFGDEFREFVAEFDPGLFGVRSDSDEKRDLLQLLVQHPDRKEEILWMWMTLFPEDDWARDLVV